MRIGSWRPAAEIRIVAMLVAVGAVAGIIDMRVGEVRPQDPAAVEGARFVERAVFCPPHGTQSDATIAVASPTGRPLPVGLEPLSSEKTELGADRALIRSAEGIQNVVGYGGVVTAGTIARRTGSAAGWGAARCSGVASPDWYFGSGSTLLGHDQRYLLYNPFPDEAVARVVFFTQGGDVTKANLGDVPVPAHEYAVVAVNEFVATQERMIGAHVSTQRGRIVAWRLLDATAGDLPRGTQLTLGATDTSTRWYFAEGRLADGIDEQISVANPATREAVVSITLITHDQSLRTPRLVEQRIPPGTVKTFSLAEAVAGSRTELGPVSAVVRSQNGVGIVAERTTWYSGLGAEGVASEIGAVAPATRWIAAPASTVPSEDVLALLNPSDEATTVSIVLVRAGGPPLRPGPLKSVRIKAGRRVSVDLEPWTDGRAMVAVVDSTRAVVAERWAYTAQESDVSTVLGTPVEEPL